MTFRLYYFCFRITVGTGPCLTSWTTSVLSRQSLKIVRLVSEAKRVITFKFKHLVHLSIHCLYRSDDFIKAFIVLMVSFRMWRISWSGGTQWSVGDK